MVANGGKPLTFYEADSADIHLGRLDENTVALNIGGTAQPQPAGPATSPFWYKVSRAKNEYGLRPRYISVCFTTTAPNSLELGEVYDVVVLTAATFNALTVKGLVTYQGEEAEIQGKTPESIYPGI